MIPLGKSKEKITARKWENIAKDNNYNSMKWFLILSLPAIEEVSQQSQKYWRDQTRIKLSFGIKKMRITAQRKSIILAYKYAVAVTFGLTAQLVFHSQWIILSF